MSHCFPKGNPGLQTTGDKTIKSISKTIPMQIQTGKALQVIIIIIDHLILNVEHFL